MGDDRLKSGLQEGEGDEGGRSNNPGPSIREDVVIEWVPKIDRERPERDDEPEADPFSSDLPGHLDRGIQRDPELLP